MSPSACAARRQPRSGVSALRIERSQSRARVASQPGDERPERAAVEVAQPDPLVEVAQREGRQQAPVLGARALRGGVVPAARVAVAPPKRVRVQRRPAPPLGFLRRSAQLELARLRERRNRFLALTPIGAIDDDVARAAAIHARPRGALEHLPAPPRVLPRCRRCCHAG
jgi:hypothetical protein